MKCPSCAGAELIHDTRDVPYTYKGESTLIPDVTGDFCPSCGEMILDAAESTRTSLAMLGFNKQVNASIIDPGFIASVRKKLALDQREAAEIFGGGVNAFSRYENGKTKPPLALVKLLGVLDRHPDLSSEVRAAQSTLDLSPFVRVIQVTGIHTCAGTMKTEVDQTIPGLRNPARYAEPDRAGLPYCSASEISAAARCRYSRAASMPVDDERRSMKGTVRAHTAWSCSRIGAERSVTPSTSLLTSLA
jgi:HTH-type transcriptional regulator / antitoxin MqsA